MDGYRDALLARVLEAHAGLTDARAQAREAVREYNAAAKEYFEYTHGSGRYRNEGE